MEAAILYDPIAEKQINQYLFAPQDNITPLEAAIIAHFFATCVVQKLVYRAENYYQWEKISRHFTKID